MVMVDQQDWILASVDLGSGMPGGCNGSTPS
jgi:hypothetical protein